MDGYTDADNTADLIAQNQQTAQLIPGGPDPYSQSVIDAYNSQFAPQAIGPQGSAALYPGLSLPEAMGNYSGSIVGSNTLFAPAGGVMAIDPVLARRKAIEDAARARASSLVPFQPEEPFQLTDPRFQKKYEEQVLGFQRQFADDMRQKYGKDWTVVASNPNTKEGREFIQAMANYETIGREFNAITDRIAAIDAGLASGELEFSDETLKLHDDYKRLLGDFEGGDVFKSKDLRNEMDKLDGFLSLEYYINQDGFLDGVMGQQGAWSAITDQGEYFQTSTGTKITWKEAIPQVAESLATGPFRQQVLKGNITQEKIEKVLTSKFKDQVTAKKSMQQKSAATRGAETEEFVVDSDAVVEYADEDGKRGQVLMPTYDPVTGRVVQGETWSVESLFDIGISLTHKPTKIKERNPGTGQVQEITTTGIPMDNIMVMNPDGSKRVIPGNVFMEMNDQTISVLDDGTIVAKSRVMVPTTTTLPGESGEEGEGLDFDTYTPQDHIVFLESGSGVGHGGTMTKLEERGFKSEESKEAFRERVQQGRDYAKKKIDARSTSQPKGKSR